MNANAAMIGRRIAARCCSRQWRLRRSATRTVASGVHFPFAWLAFNPDGEIVRSM